jgi:hypothetical protein
LHACRHRLGVIYETNLLSLISPKLKTFCQIRRKCYSVCETLTPLTKQALKIHQHAHRLTGDLRPPTPPHVPVPGSSTGAPTPDPSIHRQWIHTSKQRIEKQWIQQTSPPIQESTSLSLSNQRIEKHWIHTSKQRIKTWKMSSTLMTMGHCEWFHRWHTARNQFL